MPRRREIAKRELPPDPIYGSGLVTRFVNTEMLDGKRSVAEGILYGSLDIIKERTGDDPLKVFKKAVENAKPALEVKSRRVGGSNYQVPIEVNPNRRLSLSIRYFAANESWAAETENRLVGFYTLLDRNETAWLENLWVLPEYIGTGIGRALFLHAAGLARGRGYRLLQLEADPNAAGCYEKMGMHRLIGARQYEVDGQPRVLPGMEMCL